MPLGSFSQRRRRDLDPRLSLAWSHHRNGSQVLDKTMYLVEGFLNEPLLELRLCWRPHALQEAEALD